MSSNSTIGKKEPAANDQISRTMSTTTTTSVGKNVLANEKRIAEREVSSVKNTQLSRTQTNTQISRSEESSNSKSSSYGSSQFGLSKQTDINKGSQNSFSDSTRIISGNKKKGKETDETKKQSEIQSNDHSTGGKFGSVAPKKNTKKINSTTTGSGGSFGTISTAKKEKENSQFRSLLNTIHSQNQLSRSGKADRDAAVQVGNSHLDEYKSILREMDKKYFSKDYGRYLSGYKAAAEKLETAELDYLVNKEFIDDYYHNTANSYDFSKINIGSGALKKQLSDLQASLNELLERSDNMPDLRIYAEYKEKEAKIQTALKQKLTKERNEEIDRKETLAYNIGKKAQELVSNLFPDNRTAQFAIQHPNEAWKIGPSLGKIGRNITTDATRFSSNIGLPNRIDENGKDISEGTEINALRHVLWISTIKSRYGAEVAEQIGNAHEDYPDALDNVSNPYQHKFSSRAEADPVIDLLNNAIAMDLANSIPEGTDMNDICRIALDDYYRHGYNIAKENPDGTFSIVIYRIPETMYRQALETLDTMNEHGKVPKQPLYFWRN